MSAIVSLIIQLIKDSWDTWTEKERAAVIAACGPLPTPGAIEASEARIAAAEDAARKAVTVPTIPQYPAKDVKP
jgi:hypothetical protein